MDRLQWSPDGSTFTVGGLTFRPFGLPTDDIVGGDGFLIGKTEELLHSWLELLARHEGGRVVELGMFRGGSLMLTALLAKPTTLVGIDIAEPVALHPPHPNRFTPAGELTKPTARLCGRSSPSISTVLSTS